MDSNLLRLPDGAEQVTDADEEVSLIWSRCWPVYLGYSIYVADLPRVHSSEPETG